MSKKDNEKKHIRKFGFGLTVFLSLTAGLQIYKGNSGVVPYFFIGSFVALCVSFAVPIALKPIYIPMMYIAHAIGWFNTRVLLGLIFFLIFSPIGIFLRIIRKDLLNRKFDNTCKSYWTKIDKQVVDRAQYERQF